MRSFAAAALILVAACGGDSTSSDLAVDAAAGDLTFVAVGCAGYRHCLDACVGGTPYADCTLSCGATAKPGASDRFVAALTCAQDHCLGDTDAGDGACARAGAQLVNRDGTTPAATDPSDGSNPAKACYGCLHDATAQLFGVACRTMSSPDCNPSGCQHFVDVCLDDTP